MYDEKLYFSILKYGKTYRNYKRSQFNICILYMSRWSDCWSIVQHRQNSTMATKVSINIRNLTAG